MIPYGDPNPTTHFKNVFDIGEYGLGPLTNSLSLGCDCVGEIRYLDAVTQQLTGDLFEIPNAICIHEEDYGLLWKHTDQRGRVDRARSRRLVISSIATVGNYEYGFFWYLYQDGTWQFEAKLTGIVHSAGWVVRRALAVLAAARRGLRDEPPPALLLRAARPRRRRHGQHGVPGRGGLRAWGPGNPDGDAFRPERRTFTRESDGRSDLKPETARRFRVENPARPNRIGDAGRRTSWCRAIGGADAAARLVGAQARAVHRPQPLGHAVPRRRALSGRRVPEPARGRRRPAGWTGADRPLEGEDVVLWYVFGAHHFPRLEDWPVMPVAYCGFTLRPVGFFERESGARRAAAGGTARTDRRSPLACPR